MLLLVSIIDTSFNYRKTLNFNPEGQGHRLGSQQLTVTVAAVAARAAHHNKESKQKNEEVGRHNKQHVVKLL